MFVHFLLVFIVNEQTNIMNVFTALQDIYQT